MKIIGRLASVLLLVFCTIIAGCENRSTDEAELLVLLGAFLVEVDSRKAHDAFWADDLVYTSSDGSRFGKAAIMSGFDISSDEQEAPVDYVAQDIDIRLYGQTAVIAFKLRGSPTDGSGTTYYFNTGTFVKRNGDWQAVAWQATKIPVKN